MGKVKDILKRKDNAVLSISPDTLVIDALRLMNEYNVGSVLIVENKRLFGLFTERDYARKVFLKGLSSLDTEVREIMADELITVSPDTNIEDCMSIMSEFRTRHLPVLQDDVLVGVISIGDVVKYIIDEKEAVIEHFRMYISG